MPHSRRDVLKVILGWLAARPLLAAVPQPDLVRTALAGFERTAMHARHYRVDATVIAIGIPIFRRQRVGGGYAAVETGLAGDASGVALQFAAGSWPDRSAGLNRFGVLREAVVSRGAGATDLAFAGFITSTKEENLADAKKALKSNGDGAPVTLAWGAAREGRVWAKTEMREVPQTCNWTEAEAMLADLLREAASDTVREGSSQGVAPFLAVMRRAGLSREKKFSSPFLHNGKLYRLDTSRDNDGSLDGTIFGDDKKKRAEFRTWYAADDTTGLPLRIEYRAKSYLRLTFEAIHQGELPVPTLFPE